MKKTFKTAFEPGIYHNLEEKTYRADGALSTSDYKLLSKTPNHFRAKAEGKLPYIDSPAMRLGRLFHTYALERDEWNSTVKVCPLKYQDKRLKESKQWWSEMSSLGVTVVKSEEYDVIRSMHDAYIGLNDVKAAVAMPHNTEVSVFCQNLIGQNDTKCRIDLMTGTVTSKSVTVVDIKTTRAGGADPREFARTSRALKYHWQQANYTRMLAQKGISVDRWVWAVVEKEPPYEAAAYVFSSSDMEYALAELKEADKRLLACQELDSWPSHTPGDAVELNLFNSGVKF
jgi:hypothetical protein